MKSTAMKIGGIWFILAAALSGLPLVVGIVVGLNLRQFDNVVQAASLFFIPAALLILGLICWKKGNSRHSKIAGSP